MLEGKKKHHIFKGTFYLHHYQGFSIDHKISRTQRRPQRLTAYVL